MHLHAHLLVTAKPQYKMSCRQRNVQSDEEISTLPTPTSPISERRP